LGRATVAAILASVALAPTARGADFTDPGARVFTLETDPAVSAVAALPGGDIVYSVAGEALVRLSADGASHVVRTDGAYLLAASSSGTVLRVPEPLAGHPVVRRVERVDLETGSVSRLGTLPGRWQGNAARSAIDALTVLDDGTAIAATTAGFYTIAPAGGVRHIPHPATANVPHGGLAPLPHGRFAYPEGNQLMAGDRSGGRWLLARGTLQGPIAASGDGGVLATFVEYTLPRTVTVVHVGTDGGVAPRLALPSRPFAALGDGDGLPLFQEDAPTDWYTGVLALAGDGSLLFASDPSKGHGLRALVPPGSIRPRIAPTQEAFTTAANGRVGFTAGVPGTVSAIVERGGAVLAEGRGEATQPGPGELTIAPIPAPGRYQLRLRLTTAAGSTDSLAPLDTRTLLPLGEARTALTAGYENSDGDEGGSAGSELGDCRRDAPRVVRCALLEYVTFYVLGGPHSGESGQVDGFAGWVTATLLGDGVHTADDGLPGALSDPRPCLTVTIPRHQHAGARRGLLARVRARCTGRVTVTADLRWHTGHTTLTRARTLRRGHTWQPTLRPPRQALAAARAGQTVHGQVVVRAAIPSPYGTIPEAHGFPVFIRR
jgi:hypothetical protein